MVCSLLFCNLLKEVKTVTKLSQGYRNRPKRPDRDLALISKAAIFKALLLIIGLASKNQFGVPVISVNSGLRPSTSVLVFGPFNT